MKCSTALLESLVLWGGGEGVYPTKIKDMTIRNCFPHQFTPAVPKGTVADIIYYITTIKDETIGKQQ